MQRSGNRQALQRSRPCGIPQARDETVVVSTAAGGVGLRRANRQYQGLPGRQGARRI